MSAPYGANSQKVHRNLEAVIACFPLINQANAPAAVNILDFITLVEKLLLLK